MKRTLLLAFCLLLGNLVFCQKADGWQPLFNEKDLSGWKKLGGNANYRVENGQIVGVSNFGAANTFLCTEQVFNDFILELEVKTDPALNSGIQFRSNSSPDFKAGRVHGYQAEIDASPRAWSGGIYDEARRGWLVTLAENEAGRAAFKSGEWNRYRIEAIGSAVRIWVNGTQTANLLDDGSPTGFIALQVHSIDKKEFDGTQVRWRNVRIKTANLEAERWQTQSACPEENLLSNFISDAEKRKGWRLLWDGKSSAGWRSARSENFPEKGWTMQNGELTVLPTTGGESSGGGDIVTTERFGNFELRLEFKITEGANSGIKYFVQPDLNKGEGSAIGCEFQILDDAKHPDASQGVKGNRTVGGLYDLIPPVNLTQPGRGKEFRGTGEWNLARIVVRGNHVEHWLNGFKMLEYERNTPMFNALVAYSKYKIWENFGNWTDGHILLQDHGNQVAFRSVKIREF